MFALAFATSARAQLVKPNSVQFEQFIADLWKDAQAKGISRGTFNKAFNGVTPNPRVIATTKKQPEYNKPAGDYVTSIASTDNAKAGAPQGGAVAPDLQKQSRRNSGSNASSFSRSGAWRPHTVR